MPIADPASLLHRPPDAEAPAVAAGPSEPKPAELSLELFKTAYERLTRHAGNSLSGGLAFGALLSISPLAIVVIAIASAVLGEGAARQETLELVRGSLGTNVEPMVAEWIDQAHAWSTGATVVGIVMFLLGGARLVGMVDESFEIVFEVPPRKDESVLQALTRWASSQAMQVAISLVAGLFMAASLILRTVGTALLPAIDHPVLDAIGWMVQELVAFAVWTGAIALIYRFLPPVRLTNGDVLRGAVVSAALLEVALLVLRALASTLELGAAYGAAGAVVAMLLTLYVAGQLFLFGAEVTAELADRRDGPGADRLTQARAARTAPRPERRETSIVGPGAPPGAVR